MKAIDFILAFFFPPLAVLVKFGAGKKFVINVLLTLLGWFPGMIHALISVNNAEPKLAGAGK